jgi:lipoic acid synthetase
MNRKPNWLKQRISGEYPEPALLKKLKAENLCTVCAEAHCPNQWECFQQGTATFMLLGPHCTRNCKFCAVQNASVQRPDPNEPMAIAKAVYELELSYCVLTMVTRDDLEDGGAEHLVQTVEAVWSFSPGIRVELLISDLAGNWKALERILALNVDVLNHNIETVPRLYSRVRPLANYRRSLELLKRASTAKSKTKTKSGMMVGLGENRSEIYSTMDDLRGSGCSILTIGQYLMPSGDHHPVARYLSPVEFKELEEQAIKRGFSAVASAPLVRSSYKAHQLLCHALD